MKKAENSIIDIGIQVNLEKMVGTKVLIQSTSGGGKSYAVRKMAEEVNSMVQQIIIDPEGEFVTLREKFNFILVGQDGDIPISVKYAETIAHKLLEMNISAILDLSEMNHADRIGFVDRFCNAMIHSPKELWHSCIVYIDEAHLFCPESGRSESAGSVIDLCTRGRKRGFGVVLATQRLSKLHKDAAAECQNKMIGLTTQDIDRKRAAEELGISNKAQILALRNLKVGEFYCFGPAMSADVVKFRVSPVKTTHLRAGRGMHVNPPTPDAIKKILSRLADIPKEAESDLITKESMREEIARLKALLKQQSGVKDMIKAKENTNSDQLLAQARTNINEKQSQIEQLKSDLNIANSEKQMLLKAISEMKQTCDEAIGKMQLRTIPIVKRKGIRKMDIPEPGTKAKDAYQGLIKQSTESPMSLDVKLPVGEKAILVACIQFVNGLSRGQLTVLTGYKRSSRDAYIQRLKEKKYLVQHADVLKATELGITAAGNYKPLPTGFELQEYWLNKLPAGEAKILKVLIDIWPDSISRDVISDSTGYMRSSRDAYIQRMLAKEILTIPDRGMVKASDTLFG